MVSTPPLLPLSVSYLLRFLLAAFLGGPAVSQLLLQLLYCNLHVLSRPAFGSQCYLFCGYTGICGLSVVRG